jgi:hypothetical protein
MNEEAANDASEQPSPPVAEPSKAPARDDVGALTTTFIQEIDSLADTLPLALRSIREVMGDAVRGMTRFVQDHSREGSVQPTSIAEDVHRLQRLSCRLQSVTAAYALVPRSFVVTLVSQYDAFLSRLIEALLLTKPDVLSASEKTFSFAELLDFGSVEAVRDQVIEREVEAVLRKSHTEQFDWLEKKFDIPLRKDLSVWPRFVELTERRNLFVHTGGQVSSQYIQNCKAQKVDCSEVERGQILSVDPAYYKAAHEAILEVGVKLAQVLWRKIKPGDLASAGVHLNSVTYSLLAEEKYVTAKALLDFATEVLKKHASSEQRLILVVNRVQAYKWSGESLRARQILDREDFSALDERFKLAEAVLRDDFPRAINLVRSIGRSGAGTLGTYRAWPLYQELRKQAEFQAVIAEVFGEPLNKLDIPVDASLCALPDDWISDPRNSSVSEVTSW